MVSKKHAPALADILKCTTREEEEEEEEEETEGGGEKKANPKNVYQKEGDISDSGDKNHTLYTNSLSRALR